MPHHCLRLVEANGGEGAHDVVVGFDVDTPHAHRYDRAELGVAQSTHDDLDAVVLLLDGQLGPHWPECTARVVGHAARYGA